MTPQSVDVHGQDFLSVVGESFHRDELDAITGGGVGEHRLWAFLLREPQNPHDPNAIAVVVKERIVGHLSADRAMRTAPWLDSVGGRAHCPAQIRRADPSHNWNVVLEVNFDVLDGLQDQPAAAVTQQETSIKEKPAMSEVRAMWEQIGRVGRAGTKKHVTHLENAVGSDETPIAVFAAQSDGKFALLLITDRRLIVSSGFFGNAQVVQLGAITHVERRMTKAVVKGSGIDVELKALAGRGNASAAEFVAALDDARFAAAQKSARPAPAVAQPAAAVASGGDGVADQLEKLASLHAAGTLTDEEYAAAKARVLGI